MGADGSVPVLHRFDERRHGTRIHRPHAAQHIGGVLALLGIRALDPFQALNDNPAAGGALAGLLAPSPKGG